MPFAVAAQRPLPALPRGGRFTFVRSRVLLCMGAGVGMKLAEIFFFSRRVYSARGELSRQGASDNP